MKQMVKAIACTIELWMHLGGLLSTQEAIASCDSYAFFVLSACTITHNSRVHHNSFYDNCRNSHALIGKFLLSISGQTHEFIIYATLQRARADNLTTCYRKKQIDVSF